MGIKSHFCYLFFVFTILLISTAGIIPIIHAQPYYADLTITVDTAGFVTIEGITNHPDLRTINTQQYTSKQQSLWLLNITKQEVFSEFVFSLTLPKDSSISYLKSTGSIRIEENQGNLIIKGFGENKTLSIVIQYQTEKQQSSFLLDNLIYLISIPAIIIICILLLILLFQDKKQKKIPAPLQNEKVSVEIKGINHRQKQILRLLQERHTPLTQTDIQKELQIPKASISRNIRGLERKGLIEKEQVGMSNLIRLRKQ
jgi:uncharacterized membrane protein